MEALKGSSRQEETAEEVAAAAEAPAAWGFGDRDGFSVEDLLDLEEFCEADKDGADEHEAAPAAADNQEKSNDDSLQSVVSYDVVVPHAPSVPEIVDLPVRLQDAFVLTASLAGDTRFSQGFYFCRLLEINFVPCPVFIVSGA